MLKDLPAMSSLPRSAFDSETSTRKSSPSTTEYEGETSATSQSEEERSTEESVAGQRLSRAKDPFSNKTSQALFIAINELRKCRAGTVLDIPELVIVGKQSAGKSSLLESLTGIPFPVGLSYTTRFATRIVSRRTDPGTADSVWASLEYGHENHFDYSPDATLIKEFGHSIPTIESKTSFENLIKKAEKVLGLKNASTKSDKSDCPTFSSMVLKIELSGPDRSHFAILDLPGVFSTAEVNGVTKAVMNGVKAMVRSHIEKKESIIICVVEAINDLAHEDILNMTADVDSESFVGVMTKCDRTNIPERDMAVKRVISGTGSQGKVRRWHVVQNRGPNPPDSFDQEQEEAATLSREPWTQIPFEQRGTPMLKQYLADLLSRRIRNAFPGMQAQASKLLRKERFTRSQYGEPRQNHSDRRDYVTKIITAFRGIAYNSVNSPGALSENEIKLRGITMKKNEAFSSAMDVKGHLYEFTGLADTTTSTGPLYSVIREQMETNRGVELRGMINPAILQSLYRKQTEKWEDMARAHILDIITVTTEVALKILKITANEKGLAKEAEEKLKAIITSLQDDSARKAEKDLQALCDSTRTMALQTTDESFLEYVRAAKLKRFELALNRFRLSDEHQNLLKTFSGESDECKYKLSNSVVVDVSGIERLFAEVHPYGDRSKSQSNENIQDEIHDILQSYYVISRKLFVASIIQQIVEPFLQSPNGPLLGLSPENISKCLSEEDIDEIGGEDQALIRKRRESDEKIKTLEEAVRIAAHALRKAKAVTT